MNTDPGHLPRKLHKATHLVLAALAIAVSAALVLMPQRGHPPPIVLVPFVLLIWPIGHVLVWGVGWLAGRGRRSAERSGGNASPWPGALIVAMLGTGTAAITGLLQVIGSAVQGTWYPYPDPSLWAVMLLVWLSHGVCFVALLLRRPWSRFLGALLASGWAALLGVQIAEHLNPLAGADLKELLIPFGLLVLLLTLALLLAVSRAVKYFLARRESGPTPR